MSLVVPTGDEAAYDWAYAAGASRRAVAVGVATLASKGALTVNGNQWSTSEPQFPLNRIEKALFSEIGSSFDFTKKRIDIPFEDELQKRTRTYGMADFVPTERILIAIVFLVIPVILGLASITSGVTHGELSGDGVVFMTFIGFMLVAIVPGMSVARGLTTAAKKRAAELTDELRISGRQSEHWQMLIATGGTVAVTGTMDPALFSSLSWYGPSDPWSKPGAGRSSDGACGSSSCAASSCSSGCGSSCGGGCGGD